MNTYKSTKKIYKYSYTSKDISGISTNIIVSITYKIIIDDV